MKKKTIRNLIICMLVLVMTMSLFAGCEVASTETTGAPAETQPEKPVALNYDLYYHVSAATRYSVDADDGTVHIPLWNKGRAVTVRAVDLKAAGNVSSEIVMVLVKNDKDLVVDVQTVEEIGASFAAKWAYITEIDETGKQLTVNGDTKVTLTGATVITDTTGKTAVGNSVKLRVGDCVTAVANSNGEVTHLFLVSKKTYGTISAVCEHCSPEKKVTWTPINTDSNTLPTATGHYYLPEDMLGNACTLAKGAKVCFDLHGNTLTVGTNQRLFSLNNGNGCALAIMDTSEAKTGTIKYVEKAYANANGGLVWASKGNFYMYGGTLDASNCMDNGNGVAVYVGAGMTFEMKAGTIIGGTTSCIGSAGGDGGAVYATGTEKAPTTVNIAAGCVIKDGKAEDTCKDQAKGRGGVMYLGNYVTLNNAGTITGGTALVGPCVWANVNATINNTGTIENIFQVQPAEPAA